MHRLLVISCSQSKTCQTGLLPAIDRYDGPAFRVLRKYLRENSETTLTALILSAKYGLIESDRKIPYYDCRLSRSSAMHLRPQILETLARVIQSKQCRAVGVCAGKDYRVAFDGLSELIPAGIRIDFLTGGLGLRLTRLRDWLLHSVTVDQEGRVGLTEEQKRG